MGQPVIGYISRSSVYGTSGVYTRGDDARCVIEILGGVVKILLAITANNNSDNSNKIF